MFLYKVIAKQNEMTKNHEMYKLFYIFRGVVPML